MSRVRKPTPQAAAKQAARNAARFKLDSGWFDLWHTHFDWEGYGRKSRAMRRQFLVALFRAFERALAQARRRRRIQIFLSISRAEPEQDALYVHTPNPNGSSFPHRFPGFRPLRRLPAFVAPHVDRDRFEVLSGRFGGTGWYVVRPHGS